MQHTAASPAARYPWTALAATSTVQALGSLCLAVPAVLAPAVAPALGIGSDRVGVFVGLAYLAAMMSGLASGHGVARLGAIGLSQVTLTAFGCGLLAVGTGHALPAVAALLVAVALLFGGGYGFINPSSAALIARHASPAHRGVMFSLKQSGVPAGVALAGVLMPPAVALLGWPGALVTLGLVCLAGALSLQALRRPLEPERTRAARSLDTAAPASAPIAPAPSRPPALARVLRDPDLRRLSIASFAFAVAQLAFTTYLVSYLNLSLGTTLAAAAGVLAISQAISVGARIGWGAVADRFMSARALLGWLGVGAAASLLGLAALEGLAGKPAFGMASLVAASLCAATSVSWNGVYFAELARLSPPAELPAIAGAAQCVTFLGSTAGPIAFSELLRAGTGYPLAFALVAVLPFVAGVMMLVPSRQMIN